MARTIALVYDAISGVASKQTFAKIPIYTGSLGVQENKIAGNTKISPSAIYAILPGYRLQD
jgi:hypothetical protein